MFSEMMGDLRGMIRNIGLAVVFSLFCVSGNAMAMALRERTTEVAVLKAIGFSKGLVIFLVLAEAVLVAGLGGVLGALGSKLLFDVGRHLPVQRRVPPLLLRPLAHGPDGPGRLVVHRVRQRAHPRDPRGAALGDQRPEEGGLNRP